MAREKGTPRPPRPPGVASNPRNRSTQKARGHSAPTLDDVARRVPKGNDLDLWFQRQDAASDRDAALAYAALLESVLEDALSGKMMVVDDRAFKELFRGPRAPLGSFAAKTQVGHALGLFNDEMRSQMDELRRIRNAFAHAITHIDFSEPAVRSAALKLDSGLILRPDAGFSPRGGSPRERYEDVAELMIAHLLAFADYIKQGVKAGTISLPSTFESKYA